MKNGKINTEVGRFRIVNVNAMAISLTKIKITSRSSALVSEAALSPEEDFAELVVEEGLEEQAPDSSK